MEEATLREEGQLNVYLSLCARQTAVCGNFPLEGAAIWQPL